MRKFLLVLTGLVALAAIALGAASFAKSSSDATRASALRGQLDGLRSELATPRSDLHTTSSALASAKSELAGVRSEVAKTSKGTKLGYCVQYFTPQDGNIMSYNVPTGNKDYTDVYGLIENISTPQLVNGVWECPGGGTFVPLAQ